MNNNEEGRVVPRRDLYSLRMQVDDETQFMEALNRHSAFKTGHNILHVNETDPIIRIAIFVCFC
jgi:hypothetical protein